METSTVIKTHQGCRTTLVHALTKDLERQGSTKKKANLKVKKNGIMSGKAWINNNIKKALSTKE